MNILAFDTCFDACSAAAAAGFGGPSPRVAVRFEPMQTGHAERLVPMIEAVMADAGVGWEQTDRIGVTTGPGTFTGTRIAVAAARALALARHIPLVELSSLEVLAHGLPASSRDPRAVVLVAADARRDEVYVQAFDGADLSARSLPVVLSLDAAARLEGARPLVIVGSGAHRLADAARRLGRVVLETHPDVRADIANVLHRIAAGVPAAGPVRPLYLRPPDAKPQEGKSIPRAHPSGRS